MKNIVAIVGKEMRLYFASPIIYVMAAVFLLIADFLFYSQISLYSIMRFQQNLSQMSIHQVVFQPSFMNMGIILLLMVPLLTMRLISEEKKGRTLELLLTSPVSIIEIVFAKFLAAFLVYLILLTMTLHVPLILATLTTVSIKPLISSYLGLAMMGGVFVSFGLFASTLSENQIIAAVTSFGILIGLWLIRAGDTGGETPMDAVLNFLSLVRHLDNMVKGLIDTRDISYFISLTTMGLFLSHRIIESTRWK
ncbi:MAG: ABC transporter permease subunit [Nitrospirae bacterium]|nr:ABC transporter permease subunit [Candidatus Troglogloeales bacterium]